MKVQELMTENPACCTPDMPLQQVARMMVECDCGAIPVVENMNNRQPIGMVTDRDIVVRGLAAGRNPMEMSVRDVMSDVTVTVDVDENLTNAVELMEKNQVRRLIVTNGDHHIVGMLAQADIARRGRDHLTGEMVEEISEPVGSSKQRSGLMM
jgi:CBS domain-containing protein